MQSEAKRGVSSTDKIVEELHKLSEELLARNHRAATEVREAVNMVASELVKTADKLKTSVPSPAALRDEVAVQAHLALLEAKDRLGLLEELVKRALAGAESSPTFIGETARMKLALARMEAADVFEEKRRLLREERRRFQTAADAALADLDARIIDLVDTAAHM